MAAQLADACSASPWRTPSAAVAWQDAEGTLVMRAVDNPIQVRELVPAIVGRLPVILTEVGELLAEQQSDYAAFLAEGIEEVLGAAEGFIARLIGLADREPSTMAPSWPPARNSRCSRRSGASIINSSGT
jgi:hypothetical protein